MKRYIFWTVFFLLSLELSANSPEITGYLPSYRLESSLGAMGSNVLDLSAFQPDYRAERIVSQANLKNNSDSFPINYKNYSIESWYGSKVDRIIYFSVKPGDRGSLDLTETKERDLARLQNMKHSYGTVLNIAVSGSSLLFAPMTASKDFRKKFLDNLLQFCQLYSFTGVDFDWEFPKTDVEMDNFSLLIEEAVTLYSEVDITVSAAVSRDRPLKQEIYDRLHSINLMAYDFRGRHSTYESAVEAAEYLQIKYSIAPEKINLGIPFYGRIFNGLNPQYWTKSMIYRDILSEFEIKPNQDEAGGFFYNGIETVKKKTKYVRENKLGGVMIWELGQDTQDEFSLLNAIREELQ